MKRTTFRSGRLPASSARLADKNVSADGLNPPSKRSERESNPSISQGRRHLRRGRGRGLNNSNQLNPSSSRDRRPHHPASRTLDLGKLGRDEDLGIHEGAPAQLRSGGFTAFFKNLFSRGEDTRTRPHFRMGDGPSGRFNAGHGRDGPAASSGRLGRHAAASSLGSLQSYATSTIKGSNGPIPSCLTQGSTSEVGMKKRVFAKREMDEEPVFSQEVRDKTLLSKRPDKFTYPNFALAEFGGRETWASDVFVLPHNAIRWEVMDLYTILSSIQRRWASLAMVDVWELSEYWEVFEVFVAQYFEIEDQIVFPYMLSLANESSDLKRYHKVVKYNRDRLENMLLDVGSTLELFNTNPAGEVLPKVYSQLSTYLPKLLDYMQQQENVLPNVFAQYCEPEDRALLNRASANFIIRAANGRDGIAILTRWIEDSMILQVWKNENLSSRAQSSHKRWIANLEANHVDIARRFQRRMRSLPKSDNLDDNNPNQKQNMPDRQEMPKKLNTKSSFRAPPRRGLQTAR